MNRRFIIAAAALATGMAFIDTTALTVALPALQADLAASPNQLLWIHNAYAVPLAALLLLGGSLGDRYGTRRIFTCGVILFAIASAACGMAPGANSLIGFRALQGIGAAFMIPGSLALIARAHPEGGLGRAIGLWSAFTVIASALGPVMGGLLAQHGMWRGVFLVNLPIAAATLFLTLTRISPDPPRTSHLKPNLIGSLLLATSLGTLSATLISPSTIFIVVSALGLAAFLIWEKKVRLPMLPPHLFRSRQLSIAAIISLLLYAAWGGFTFLLPTHLIRELGASATQAGLLQLPAVILLAAVAPLAGRLCDRLGPRVPLLTGNLLCAFGFFLTSKIHSLANAWLPLAVLGLGLGLCAAPLSTTILSSVTDKHHGLAAGINSTISRIAQALGVALLGALAFRPQGGFSMLCLSAAILALLAAITTLGFTWSKKSDSISAS